MGDRHNKVVGAAANEEEKQQVERKRRIRVSWSGGEVAYCCQKLQNISRQKRRTQSEGDRCTTEEVEEESRYDECVIHLRFVGGFELKNITAQTITALLFRRI